LIFPGAWDQLIEYGNKLWWQQRRTFSSRKPQVRIVYENDMPITTVVTGSKDSDKGWTQRTIRVTILKFPMALNYNKLLRINRENDWEKDVT